MSRYYRKYLYYKNEYKKLKYNQLYQFGGDANKSNESDKNNTFNKNNGFERIVVFDFDNTMTTFSIPNEIMRLRGDKIYDIGQAIDAIVCTREMSGIFSELFNDKDFLSYLRATKLKGKVKFVVMSFGFKQGIEILLKKLNIYDLFEGIYTPMDFGLAEGFHQAGPLKGKNVMLERMKKDLNVEFDNKNILLIDDHEDNTNNAKVAGYKVIYVKGSCGLTHDYRKEINKFIENM